VRDIIACDKANWESALIIEHQDKSREKMKKQFLFYGSVNGGNTKEKRTMSNTGEPCLTEYRGKFPRRKKTRDRISKISVSGFRTREKKSQLFYSQFYIEMKKLLNNSHRRLACFKIHEISSWLENTVKLP
jgi:hypothetical protein